MRLFYVCPQYRHSDGPNYGMMVVAAEDENDAIAVARRGTIDGEDIKSSMDPNVWFSDNPIIVTEIDTTKDIIIGVSDD